jgi:FkbM family methyltransferase
MRKIFLDCGLYDGIAIKQYVYDGSWEVRSFEPNKVKAAVIASLPGLELIPKAVWIEDGTVDFIQDKYREDAARIPHPGEVPEKRPKKVEAIDFSKFVSGLPRTAYIVCSMDIEGAEFAVLRKMIDDKTIGYFDILDVEFHHRHMTDPAAYEAIARSLLKEIESFGVRIRLKVPLQ